MMLPLAAGFKQVLCLESRRCRTGQRTGQVSFASNPDQTSPQARCRPITVLWVNPYQFLRQLDSMSFQFDEYRCGHAGFGPPGPMPDPDRVERELPDAGRDSRSSKMPQQAQRCPSPSSLVSGTARPAFWRVRDLLQLQIIGADLRFRAGGRSVPPASPTRRPGTSTRLRPGQSGLMEPCAPHPWGSRPRHRIQVRGGHGPGIRISLIARNTGAPVPLCAPWPGALQTDEINPRPGRSGDAQPSSA
jgi:hypothetical protein